MRASERATIAYAFMRAGLFPLVAQKVKLIAAMIADTLCMCYACYGGVLK